MLLKEKIKFVKAKISRIALAVLSLAFFVLLPTGFARADVTDFVSSIASGIIGGAAKGFTAIIMGILSPIFLLINFVLGTILYISGWVFNWALELSIKYDSTVESFVTVGWETSLQFANLFFIILLLAIAIATILELGNFNYKKALPRFLMVALLINFSMVIGGVVLDATNVFAKFFSDSIAKSSTDTAALVMHALGVNEIKNADQASLANLGNTLANFGDIFGLLFYQIFFQAIAIFVLLSGAVYMISRAFWIWLLLMIAPLAWIAYVFPEGSTIHSQWKKWWEQYLCWCIFAPAYLFFTYLALVISGTTFANMVTNKTLDAYNAGALIQIAVVGFLMTSGLFIGKKIGCGGGNFVISWGTKQMGDFKGTLSKLRSQGKIGKFVSEIGQKGGELTARGIAAVPGAGRLAGYEKEVVSARIKKEREKEREKEIAQEAEKLENRGTWELHSMIDDIKKGTGTSSIQKAAAVKILMSRGEEATAGLSEIELGYMRQAEAAAKSTLDRKDNISVPYVISFKARKEEVDKNLKNIESAGSKYEKEDINRLYSIYQGALHTGRTSPRTASILTALENRIDEIIPIILPGATVQQINAAKSKMKSNIKSAKNAASKGKTRTTYLP